MEDTVKYCTIRVLLLFLIVGTGSLSYAHFQTLIPSTPICEDPAQKSVSLDLTFCHPFEGNMMQMEKPIQFGVLIKGEKSVSLLSALTQYDKNGFSAWQATYTLTMPGDHVFYVEPAPYWEPAEECFIIHYTKVVVNAFGMEVGWDVKVGLKTEIIPLTRPYGLYTGNVFQGIVLVNETPAPFCEVEVEYFNDNEIYTAPAGPFITQVIKTDANGVFTYAMPAAGWWGFAALNEDDNTLRNPNDGRDYPIEIGALIWVHVQDME
jgi:cobalt/nickel transport protein